MRPIVFQLTVRLLVERKFTFFALYYFVFEGNCQVQAPPPPRGRGGLYLAGWFNGEFFCVTSLGGFVGGVYPRRGLFSEFYGIFANWTQCWGEKKQINKSRFFAPQKPSVFSPGTSARWCWERDCLSRGFFPSLEDRWKRFKIKNKWFFFQISPLTVRERNRIP